MIKAKGYAAMTAKALLGPFSFERRDPGPRDVEIEILYCGVCHSDIHQARDEWGDAIFPMVPGHEILGKVIAAGKDVKKFRTGDLGAIGCMVDSCKTCENCKQGLEQYCLDRPIWTYNAYEKDGVTPTYGGYSDRIVAREDFVLKVSGKLDLRGVAPLLCAGITTYSPLRHWGVGTGHRIGILGLGGLGHMAVKFASSFGAEVTVLSTSPGKQADAKRLGAHHFVLTTDEEKMKSLKNHFDFIFDAVSAQHDYNKYLKLMRTNGVHICVGIPPLPEQIKIQNLITQRRSIAGSVIGGIPETQEMLDYCESHGIVSDVEVIDIRYINEAYERMLRGDVRYRFVIDMTTLK